MKMLKRDAAVRLQHLAAQFPVVTVLGPRQSGKTTLVRSVFPNYEYLNMELPSLRLAAQQDAVGFFRAHNGPLILDEIQRIPELLSYVQAMVDEQRQNGRFVLTGSHQPQLAAGVGQSLAGRTGLLRLLPLSIEELAAAGVKLERDACLHKGFMPGIHANGIDPNDFFQGYYQTYVERDVRQLINLGNQRSFETFIRLLAGRVGQVANLNSLSSDTGVSRPTLGSWLSVLEASYVVFQVPCYFNNFGKRLAKASKIYFTEVGLAAWLLGIASPAQVARDPAFGGLFENMVVIEALKARTNAGKMPELYYFRDQKGFEIDLIAARGRRLLPIEIKGGMTYDPSFAKNLNAFREITGGNVETPAVIYGGEETAFTNDIGFYNFRETARLVREFDTGE